MNSSSTYETRHVTASQTFLSDVQSGLRAPEKNLPSKYFYDKRGSELFDRICELDEYYVTRTELSIMEQFASEMGKQIGPGVMLVEYGSGSSLKTRHLLDALPEPNAYVPVDISGEYLRQAAAELAADYPQIEILPVCADFTSAFKLPASSRPASHIAVYFPGSTIGNLLPKRATNVLRQISSLCGQGGGLLIGVDLKKDVATIEAAYNDARGVTREFNLNLLRRINRELGGDFEISQFRHRAVYNPIKGRVETDLVSRQSQTVTIAGETFEFDEGEAIRTEYSHKYTVQEFAELAASAGFVLHRHWTDGDCNVAVLHLVVE